MATYSARRSALEPVSDFELTNEALTRVVNGVEAQRIALAEVTRVLILRTGGGGGGYNYFAAWVCLVQTPRGRISIPSSAFAGLSRVQDQAAAFRPFLQALTRAVAARSPSAAFISRGWTRGIQVMLGSLWGLLAMLAVFSALTGLAVPWVLLGAVILGAASAACWWAWRGNSGRRFEPDTLPADMLPRR
jgi:hypothetical protein